MTQQACVIQNLSVEKQQHSIFENLNFSLASTKLSALIGRNGQGKSVLLETLQCSHLSKAIDNTKIYWTVPNAYLPQIYRLQAHTIAEALGIQDIHDAFKRIEKAEAQSQDFDLVENKWHLPQVWQQLLHSANLPLDLDFKVEKLSEGQKTKLALCRLFLLKDHYLLLDEPSNHLDIESRDWLITMLLNHPTGALVVSHDIQLLKHMQHIYAINQFGIQHYLGNYSHYLQQINLQVTALERKIENDKSEMKKIKIQQNETRLKAEKRKNNAKKSRDSQAKILLDARKNAAEKSQQRLNIQHTTQTENLSKSIQQNQERIELIKPQSFQFDFTSAKTGEILRVKHLKLPFGTTHPIDLAMSAHEKIHLIGKNGVGKSTLLKTLIHPCKKIEDEIFINANVLYLDQTLHNIFFDQSQSVLDNLAKINPEIQAVEWRNHLGRLRLRQDKSLLTINQLSGGERLKVALLALSKTQNRVDLLLLDEPENHLDIESKELLAEAIKAFHGAVLLVSHDLKFVESCGIEDTFYLSK